MIVFLIIASVFALGSLVQTIAGFGSALVVMPILTQFIGVQTAATVMAVVGATVTVAVFYQNRSGLRWREAGQLMTGTVIGIPLGTIALKKLPEAPVVGFLGVVLLAYGCFAFARLKKVNEAESGGGAGNHSRPTFTQRMTGSLVGLSAGLLGGAYAADGPPLVIYGSVKRWPKDSFRSILQACFFVDGFLIIVCHGAGGLVTRDVFAYCLYGIPGMIAGIVLGSYLDRRINHARFHKLLLGLIVLLGAALLARAFYAHFSLS